MTKKHLLALFLSFICIISLKAQESYPVNGSKDERPRLFALINATIITGNGNTIQDGTILINKDKLDYVGKNIKVPESYVVYDAKGKYIYPSFIDLYSTYGIEQASSGARASWGAPQVFETQKEGAYAWNEAIRSENKAYKVFSADHKSAENLHSFGFGAVQTIAYDGIVRGSASLVSLSKERENMIIISPESSVNYSFNKGSSRNSYPSSIMGSVALLRQTYYDADWYSTQSDEFNISLREFKRLQKLTQVFETSGLTDYYRINRLQDEFGVKYLIKANGEEYKRLDFVKSMNSPLIVPLNFPKAPKVDNPMEASALSLSQLKHWELAPSNPSQLETQGFTFAITSAGISKSTDFWKNLRLSIAHGLTEEQALKSLTSIPAKLIGVEHLLGSLDKGKIANLLVVDQPIFNPNAQILENWVQGNQYILKSDIVNISGSYQVGSDKLEIEGKPPYKATYNGKAVRLTQEGSHVWIHPNDGNLLSIEAYIASRDPFVLQGHQLKENGETSPWKAIQTGSKTSSPQEKSKEVDLNLGDIVYPFNGYGYTQIPSAQTTLFKNVKVWTNEAEGVLEQADVLIEKGKIKAIGTNLKAPAQAVVVEGEGKHLTPGIIDEHSHLALESWNEAAQAVSAEVRMLDAVNPEDINIYRQLAGGVTSSHLLHGSANPIGGQSQLIKLRWGETPEGLKYNNTHKSIKFALGENVKQSSRSSTGNRFPQTRMGVEQVFEDAFTRAYEYKKAKSKKSVQFRKDLELEAIVEILDGERDITCHSYVQSEINMLLELSDKMNFKINTFTHGLEAYKLADKIVERGISVGTFADWWGYKYEVIEATPFNASLLNQQNVLVAINSDDQEMGRRLNQEAAKMIKYGNTSEEDALKMVTLNPAKMLHIDDKVGSIKVGKDADLVLWSDNPLSIYAVAEQTYIEGVKYWDIQENEEKQNQMALEKARLLKKLLRTQTPKQN